MILFHGTTQENHDCIEAEGFLGSEIDSLTIGRHVDGGVVFLADTVEEAEEYGDVALAVHLEGVKAHKFSDGNTDHYYSFAQELNEQSWWEVV